MAIALGITHREAHRLPPVEQMLFRRHFDKYPLEQLPRLVAQSASVHLFRKGKNAPPVLPIDIAPDLYSRKEVEERVKEIQEWENKNNTLAKKAPTIQATLDRGQSARSEMMRLHNEAMAREKDNAT